MHHLKNSLILACIVFVGCVPTTPDGLSRDEAIQAEGNAVAILAWGADPVFDGDDNAPDDSDGPKPGDRCPACDGSGRSGDGIGRCGTCGGDGRIDEDDVFAPPVGAAPEEVKKPEDLGFREVVLHVTEKNYEGWPQDWWREERIKLVEQGWGVSVVRDPVESGASEAWFEIIRGDGTAFLHGFRKAEEFKSR
jgi:hypothetical protein